MDIPAHPQSEQNHSAVHFLDYWQILYARKEVVIAVLLLVVFTGIIITRGMPRVYAGTALIQVQRETPGLNVLQNAMGGRFDPVFLVSQFEIIKSRPVMERVVKDINLDVEMGAAYGWSESGSQKDIFDRTVNLVKGNTTLVIRRETDLIEIRVKFDRPELPTGEAMRVAVKVANSIAKVFEEYSRSENKRVIEAGLATLKDEIDEIGRQVSRAEDALSSFRRKHNITLITDIDNGLATLRAQIAAVTANYNNSRIVSSVKKSRYERVVELSTEEAAAALQILVGDTSLGPSVQNKEALEIKLSTLKESGLGAAHPEVLQTTVMLKEIKDKIDQRVKDVKMGLKLDFEQAQAESDMLAAHLAELEGKERDLSSGVSIEFENLARAVATLKERKMALERVLDTQRVESKIPTTSVKLIEEAQVPENPLPISPNFALNLTLSIVVGLVFGVALAFFVEYLDTTIKSVDDVEKYLATTVVGIVPNKVRTLNSGGRNAGNSEIYRVLRMNLKSSKKLADGKLLMITSASAGEGKSTTSFNLAYVCAEVGERTLLLDADLHRPVQHKILDLPGDVGLSNVIVGEASLEQAIQHTGVQNLDLLPSGQMSRFSVIGLVDTDEMRSLVMELKGRYDRIIMDTPPIIGVSDTAPLIRLADGVVQVVHHRKYPRGLCKRARDLIVGMGGNLLGIILNNIEAAHDASSYYYKYQYYYYYYYNKENDEKGVAPASRRRRKSTQQAPDEAEEANA